MLIVNERAAATRSERCVLDWMRTWTGQYVIVGLAISGCQLPDRNPGEQAREAGLVVITPRAVVVIEAEGTAPEVATGVLSVQADGRSRLLGFEGGPVHVRDGDSSSLDRVTSHVLDLAELVRKLHPDAAVDGLVVVVPPRDATIALDIEAPEHANSVVLGSSAGLRAWFHRTANRKLIWTAEQAHVLLGELRLSHVVTVEDLEAEGFPSHSGRRRRTGPRALVGAAHALSPLGAISDTPPVGNSNVAAEQPDSDGLSEQRLAEPVPPRPSDVSELPVDDHMTSTAGNSRALVGAISISKHDGPQSVSSAIADQGIVPSGPRSQPLSEPPTAPYPPWLMADIARAQARGAQRSRRAAAAQALPHSHISTVQADPQPRAAADTEQVDTEQVDTEQVGTDQVGTDQVGTDQVGTDQVGTDQVGTDQVGTDQVGTDQVGTDQVGTDQVGTDQVGTDQVGTDQVDTGQVDAEQAQADRSAPPLPSSFTDPPQSSWVDSDGPSDDDRSFRQHLTPTPPQAEPEPLPLLWPATPPAAAARPNQVSFSQRVSAARTRISTVQAKGLSTARAKGPGLILHLPKHLPTILIVAVVIGTIWILVSSSRDPYPSAVQPRPVSSTETVAPPESPAPAQPADRQCFPFQPVC
ncbi:hypothetical protein ACQP1G_32880 [Nocardia sp. CA-107356]|uniref:hypothetical protein n=1 Tax=Nocardia sp. CA-107356 TaxID=3239972 RepID=UPI003D90E561